MMLSLFEAPTRETRPDHNTGNYVPYSFPIVESVGSLTSPANHVTLKIIATMMLIFMIIMLMLLIIIIMMMMTMTINFFCVEDDNVDDYDDDFSGKSW